jgi:hypothetical protein
MPWRGVVYEGLLSACGYMSKTGGPSSFLNNHITPDIYWHPRHLPQQFTTTTLVTSWQTYPATTVTLTTELRGRQPDGVAEILRTRTGEH